MPWWWSAVVCKVSPHLPRMMAVIFCRGLARSHSSTGGGARSPADVWNFFTGPQKAGERTGSCRTHTGAEERSLGEIVLRQMGGRFKQNTAVECKSDEWKPGPLELQPLRDCLWHRSNVRTRLRVGENAFWQKRRQITTISAGKLLTGCY